MTSWIRGLAQVVLGSFLLLAGTAHLTFAREDFRAQVPPWFPGDVDFVVILSGVVELAMAAALLLAWRHPARALVGTAAAVLFVAVFPGNIAQFTEQRDAFGLTSDSSRAVRLLFQPVLVLWALWCTGALRWWRDHRASR
ncbi:DoxX family protein [Janibacter sp. GS2]|uniref:DoxX family protein n=1 Tax=Janibacter sp. GS2 TaxID=3442646 RepID=UPI003EBB0372